MSAPGTPAIYTLSPATGQLSVYFTVATGTVTTYQYSLDGGAWTTRASGTNLSPLVIPGLTNGTAYLVKIRAMNGATAGAESNTVSSTPSASAPGNVNNFNIIQGNAQLTTSFQAATSATNYQYSLDNGVTWMSRTDGGTTGTTMVISGLTNGTSYAVRVRALGSLGVASPGAQSGGLSVTPSASFPTAPTITSIAPGSFRLSVKFTAPTTGITPTNYQYSTDSGFTWITRADGQTTASPLVISSGVNNGVYYSVRIRALGDLGTGNPGVSSSSSLPVAPTSTAPGRPTITSIVPGSATLSVKFTPPTDGSGATTYQYSLNGASFIPRADGGGITSPLVISTGLTNGTAYSVRILAGNGSAYGEQSEPYSATPSVSPPGPPTITTITPYNTVLSIAFTAGTGTISGYQYSLDNGANWILRSPQSNASPFIITGLTNGTTYPVRIRAYNGGTSSPGEQSNTVSATPALVIPTTPTITATTATDGQLSIAFNAAIGATNYAYSLDKGVTWTTRASGTTASPLDISGLTNTTAYAVQIRGFNDAGDGPASNTNYPPGAPTITSITTGVNTGRLDVNFDAGVVDPSGNAINIYQYSLNGGTWTNRASGTTASPLLITGLSNEQVYNVRIRAGNGISGLPSNTVSATPVVVPPGAPTITSINQYSNLLGVQFLAGATNGNTITTYQYSLDNGSSWTTRADSRTTAGPLDISSGLTNGTAYSVIIRALAGATPGLQSNVVSATPSAISANSINILSYTILPGDQKLTVNFDQVTGATGYQYSVDNSATWTTSPNGNTDLPFDITGLTNGTEYSVRVRALGSLGVENPSNSSGGISSIPSADPPGVPTITSIAPSDRTLSVKFTAPTSGSTPSTYQYSLNSGAWITRTDGKTTESPLDISSGLSNGTQVLIRIRALGPLGALNPGGSTSATVATSSIAPPGVPTITSITAPKSATLYVAFTAPASGPAPTDYQYSLDSGASWTTRIDAGLTTSPLIIRGLTAATAYPVRIRALNGGTNSPGEQSNVVSATPFFLPLNAPTISTITPSTGQLAVNFSAPSNGLYTTYQYSLDGGEWTARASGTTATPLNIPGLTNGTPYSVKIRAMNGTTPGPESTAVSATPSASPAGTVTGLTVTQGNAQITAAFSAVAGATNFQYSLDNGASWTTRSPAATASPLVISGLTNGTSYIVRLRALGVSGEAAPGTQGGALSATPSASFPNAPTITSIAPGSEMLTVKFTAPTTGIVPTNYQYSTDNGFTWITRDDGGTTLSPIIISGLVNGINYPVKLRALDALDASNPGVSTSSFAVTPSAAAPGLPTIDSIVPRSTSLSIKFTAPTSGATPTVYQWSLNGQNWTTRSTGTTASPLDISGGLTNGTTYSVRIRAVNNGVNGEQSVPVSATPSSFPTGRPTITGITTPDSTSLSVAFTAATDGSGATGYQYSLDNGANWILRSPPSTASPINISGLTTGTIYPVRIRGFNGSTASPGEQSNMISATLFGLLNSATFLSKDYANGTFSLTYTLASTVALPTSSSAYTVNVSGGGPATSVAFVAPNKLVISDLQEYTDYVFDISANNCSNTLTTATAKTLDITAPGVVSNSSCDIGSSELTLRWSDVAVLGGSPITYYVFSSGSETVVGNALHSAAAGSGSYSYPVTGLTNRTAYSYYVRAIDEAGNVGTAVTISGTPLGPALSAPASMAVSASVNVATLTNYTVANADSYRAKLYSDSGLSVQVGSDVVVTDASGIIFSGLESATTYYATVTAERVGDVAYENSAASAAVSVVTAALTSHVADLLTNVTDASTFKASLASTVASLPASTSITTSAVDISSIVTQTMAGFTIPATANMTMFLVKDGDTYTLPAALDTSGFSYFSSAPNTSYTVAFTGGSLTFAFDASENVTIGGVAVSLGDTFVMNEQIYRYVAKGSVVVVSVPGVPTDVSGVAGDGQVVVSFTAPASTGGSDISGYTVTSSPGGITASGSSSPITVTGLTNGTAYTFTVTATNVNGGVSNASAASTAVMPVGTPGAPTIGVITALSGGTSLSVPFTAGSANGNTITTYQYSINSGTWYNRASGTTASPMIITGLLPTTMYSVRIRAYAAAGSVTGAASIAQYGLTGELLAASAPTITSITAGNQQLTVYFAAGNDGGSTITNYQYSMDNEGTWTTLSPVDTSSPIVIMSLTNGTTYTVKIRAITASGFGPVSNAVSSTPVAPITPPPGDDGDEVAPCFFGNARVLTPSGYRRMDSLKAGDAVMTPAGSEAVIERVKVTVCPAGPNTNPYVIPAGTFGASHRLLISPDHKVCLDDGRRVEAKRLGLAQEDREGTLTYYNLALVGQADMVVSGVAVESLAHVRRVVMSLADFEAGIKRRYGGLTPTVLANIKRTCRLVGPNAVEVPVIRK